jgi:hypothetical protein
MNFLTSSAEEVAFPPHRRSADAALLVEGESIAADVAAALRVGLSAFFVRDAPDGNHWGAFHEVRGRFEGLAPRTTAGR